MIDRRVFLMGAAAVAASARTAAPWAARDAGVFPASVRADFPWASAETYLNAASIHPLSVPAKRALAALKAA